MVTNRTMLTDDSAYWRTKLSGALDVSHLLLDHQRPDGASFEKDEVAINFDVDTVTRLNRLANNSPFLLYSALMAGLKACLHKYSGSDVVVVGSPARVKNERRRTAAALPIADCVNNQMTFRQLLLNVRETLLEAYNHQNFDFHDLLQELKLDHVRNRCPLFDVMLTLEEIHEAPGDVSNDLTLRFTRRGEELTGSATFNPRLSARQSVERLLRHYELLLQQALPHPDTTIGRISLLSDGERDQVLFDWNRTESPYPDSSCVHELIEAQVERTPDATGLIFGEQQITYLELNQRANQLARYLRQLGVGPEAVVGLCLDRSIEMPIALLAILKAGGAYLPLDPAYPEERLSFMLRDGGVSILVTQSALCSRLPALKTKVVCVDTDLPAIAQQDRDNLQNLAHPESAAYVIYTSGSTGQPKGVVVPHRGVCNMAAAFRTTFDIRPGMRVLQFASLSFDASISEIVMALQTGATLVLADAEQLLGDRGLLEWMNSQRIGCATLPPAVLSTLPVEQLPDLEILIVAGEACPPELLAAWAGGRHFSNNYGPTETSVWASAARCSADDRKVPIGRPIPNAQIYLLDEQMNPVPVGVPGEIYIGGVGLARGYHHRPELTAERFVPHPFSAKPGQRLYRTGDLGRFLSDGQIDFLGRIDRQVKVRGFRIEAGEIETVIAQEKGVVQSVVMARDEAGDNQQLVAYVVFQNGDHPSATDLRKLLQSKLPAFMVPSAFVFLDSLPLTPNGKVDWKALPAPAETRESLLETLTPVEEVLAGIWSEVLGVDGVDREHDFLELGGHSLLATRVFSRVREAFRVELPIRTLFDAPTLTEMAKVIERSMGTAAQSVPPLMPVARNGDLPASFGQQRLWLFHQLEPRSQLYNIPFAMRLSGPLNAHALECALSEIVKRHESLRTTFRDDDGQPKQVIAQTVNFKLNQLDLSQLPGEKRRTESRKLAIEEAQQPFDLERGPLFRATLLRLGEDEHVLLLTMHHIISDAWSLGVLTRETAELYEAYVNDLPPSLPPLPIQYADYAYWQREYLRGEVLENQLTYWRQQLAGMQRMPPLPIARSRTSQTHLGATEHLRISSEITKAIRALCRREGSTLFITLLAAFKAVLYRYSGQADLVIGSPLGNRNRPELEGLIGFFINTLPLRTDLSGNPTFRELLGRVRQMAFGAYAHQDVPLEKLIGELHMERELGYANVFPVVFVLQNAPAARFSLGEVTLSALDIYKETTQADLYLAVVESGEELSVSLKYSSDLYDAETIASLLANFAGLLAAVTTEPDYRLLDIPFQAANAGAVSATAAAAYKNDHFTF